MWKYIILYIILFVILFMYFYQNTCQCCNLQKLARKPTEPYLIPSTELPSDLMYMHN